MKFKPSFLLSSSFLVQAIQARNDDQFNYRGTDSNPSGNGNDYGPAQWEKVTCDNIETCVSQKIPLTSIKTTSSFNTSMWSHNFPNFPVLLAWIS